MDIVLPERGDCTLKSSNGAINFSIPSTTSAMIQASTSNGKIRVEDLYITVTKMEKTEFKGRMGSGRGNIDLETSNGSIVIKGR